MPKGQQQQGAGAFGALIKAGMKTAKKQAKKELKKELRNPKNKKMVKGAIKDAMSRKQQQGAGKGNLNRQDGVTEFADYDFKKDNRLAKNFQNRSTLNRQMTNSVDDACYGYCKEQKALKKLTGSFADCMTNCVQDSLKKQQGGLVSLPVAVAAGAVAGIHPMDVASAPLKMLPKGDFLPHPIDVASMPLKLLPKIEIPHPLDLLNMPTQKLRQLAGDMNVPGRAGLQTKEQLIGGILLTQEQQGGLVGGPLAAKVLPPIFPQ